MGALARKLNRLLPRRRYGIFAGTNVPAEVLQVRAALRSGGPYDDEEVIRRYEQRFAEVCGATHGISFGAGRMALYAILEALGIGEGDEVIIPAYTCVVVPNAILYRGARPVYVDIEPGSFNIDTARVAAAITPRTRALYAQHTFGVPCNVDALRALAAQRGIPIIEDAAHALGASHGGRPAGSLTEVAFFSTDHSKVINTHLGGMATTSDAALAGRLRAVQARSPFLDPRTVRRLLRSFLVEQQLFASSWAWFGRPLHSLLTRRGALFSFDDELLTTRPEGYPCRLSSAQAGLGLSQLEDLPRNLAHRRRLAQWLEGQIGWNAEHHVDTAHSTWLRYSFLVRDRQAFEAAFSRHLDLGIWFTSVLQGRDEDLQAVGYRPGSCPVAENAARHIVNFPTHPHIPLELLQGEVARNRGFVQSSMQELAPA